MNQKLSFVRQFFLEILTISIQPPTGVNEGADVS